jgi:hypothetical protein
MSPKKVWQAIYSLAGINRQNYYYTNIEGIKTKRKPGFSVINHAQPRMLKSLRLHGKGFRRWFSMITNDFFGPV